MEKNTGGNTTQTPRPPPEGPRLFMLPSMYNEAMELLMQAHDYFGGVGAEEADSLPPESKVLFSGEMSRITLRLSSIMSWLIVRKAFFDGRLEATPETRWRYRLAFPDTCLAQNAKAEMEMPDFMRGLLDRSHGLYARVKRLDEMALSEQEGL